MSGIKFFTKNLTNNIYQEKLAGKTSLFKYPNFNAKNRPYKLCDLKTANFPPKQMSLYINNKVS